MKPDLEFGASFIKRLRAAAAPETGDRRLLAILRRSLGQSPGEDLRAVAEIEGWIYGNLPERTRRHCYLVAGLFALHPHTAEGVDIGLALHNLQSEKNAAADSLRRRLSALVSSDDAQLPERLRQIIQLLRANDIGIDYGLLLSDMLDWRKSDRRVQRRWLRHFLHGKTATEPVATVQIPIASNT